MPRSRLAALTAAVLAATAVVGAPAAPLASAEQTPFTVRTLHFKVAVGEGGQQVCDIVGDLYTPSSATATRRVPAVLTTNGFGGSKDDQAGIGALMAARGYVVLSYSGLGFGGSGCKVTLDDPAFDGRAASQLISYLGGASGIAFTDAAHTTPAPVLRVVRRDARAQDGTRRAHDPRVGMVGGSYGGGVQFAAASVDPRLDTIVPLITWNDLSYALGPNNTDQSVGVTTRTPGAVKVVWGAGFSALGVTNGLQNAQGDPARLVGCPNFADFVCPALVTGGTTGYFQPDAIQALRRASVASYLRRIRIPVLLMQGQKDTLFNLNEAVATYRALRAQGTPVSMVWQSWGHSGDPAPGEIDLSAPNPRTQYETRRILRWFDHHLRDVRGGTGPRFAWFRDWIRYDGIATPAYATADRFPVGSRVRWTLGAGGTLTRASDPVGDTRSFLTPPAGLPTSLNPVDVLGSVTGPLPTGEVLDLPGTFAAWTGPRLQRPLDVVGLPKVRLRVDAPTAAASQALGPAGQLVIFVKIVDVAPDGTATLLDGTEAPVRIPDVTRPFTVILPGVVHRFAAGHRVRLVVAGGSVNYRGGLAGAPVAITSGAGQTLSLPVTGR